MSEIYQHTFKTNKFEKFQIKNLKIKFVRYIYIYALCGIWGERKKERKKTRQTEIKKKERKKERKKDRQK